MLILSVPVPPPLFFFFPLFSFLFLGWHFRVSAVLAGQLFEKRKKEERWEVELMNTNSLLFNWLLSAYVQNLYVSHLSDGQ